MVAVMLEIVKKNMMVYGFGEMKYMHLLLKKANSNRVTFGMHCFYYKNPFRSILKPIE